METKVYNLIIVDKSGSMGSVTHATITGVNETIAGIQATAKKNPEQKQLVTLMAFCGCEQRYIFDNVSSEEMRFITTKDYQPCCQTPLYDAIGNACTRIEKIVGDDPLSLVSVTILTDGYENASREFSRASIVALIERLKTKGWMFAYIGADHDVQSVAFSLKIDNVMEFKKNESDMRKMFFSNIQARERMSSAFCGCRCEAMSDEDIVKFKRNLSENYYRTDTKDNTNDKDTN